MSGDQQYVVAFTLRSAVNFDADQSLFPHDVVIYFSTFHSVVDLRGANGESPGGQIFRGGKFKPFQYRIMI